jgi:hypothetical protein
VKPHKVRYYLERRDPEFAEKMAEVLCVYRKVKLLKKAAVGSKTKPSDAVAIISYDEKPGIPFPTRVDCSGGKERCERHGS